MQRPGKPYDLNGPCVRTGTAVRCAMAWVEDKATWRDDLSDDPATRTGGRGSSPPRLPLRDWYQRGKFVNDHPDRGVVNSQGPKLRFTLHHYRIEKVPRSLNSSFS